MSDSPEPSLPGPVRHATHKWVLFNANDWVRVKLTDYGKKIHRAEWRKAWSESSSEMPIVAYREPSEDKDGWSYWQLWQLMELFGGHVANLTQPNVFDLEMEFMNYDDPKTTKPTQ